MDSVWMNQSVCDDKWILTNSWKSESNDEPQIFHAILKFFRSQEDFIYSFHPLHCLLFKSLDWSWYIRKALSKIDISIVNAINSSFFCFSFNSIGCESGTSNISRYGYLMHKSWYSRYFSSKALYVPYSLSCLSFFFML